VTTPTDRFAELRAAVARDLGGAELTEHQSQLLGAYVALARRREVADAATLAGDAADDKGYLAVVDVMRAIAAELGLSRAAATAQPDPADDLDTARRVAYLLATADAKVTTDAAAAVPPLPVAPAASDAVPEPAPSPMPEPDALPAPPPPTIVTGPRYIEGDWNNRSDNKARGTEFPRSPALDRARHKWWRPHA
jgi:hypothetical protein